MPEPSETTRQNCSIKIIKNGPYLVSGAIPIFSMTIECDNTGIPIRWIKGKTLQTTGTYTLCRCGQSSNKPFCDGSHIKADFDGTEVSDNEPFEKMAKTIDGPELTLKDAEILCASARFCHRGGDIWPAILKSDDFKTKENAIQNACDCPSGRLVVLSGFAVGFQFIHLRINCMRFGTELLFAAVENQLTNHFATAVIILRRTER